MVTMRVDHDPARGAMVTMRVDHDPRARVESLELQLEAERRRYETVSRDLSVECAKVASARAELVTRSRGAITQEVEPLRFAADDNPELSLRGPLGLMAKMWIAILVLAALAWLRMHG
jgi:hypothetical protein